MDASTPMYKTAIEYTAQAVSPVVGGEVKLTIGENAFTAAALFDGLEIPFTQVNALEFADYTVTVRTDEGDFAFSRMGQWARPFYDALCGAYNRAVLRAFFVSGKPLLTAEGDYRFTESGMTASGKAPIHLYENCVVLLPPNAAARRVPFCFTSGYGNGSKGTAGDYELTLKLITGESYSFSRLGYNTAPFAEAVEKQIRALRGKTLAAVRELDPTLTVAQASRFAGLIPEGAAAPMELLAEIAPSFAAAAEAGIAGTRAAESYAAFKELCGSARIWMGFRKNEARPDCMAGGEPWSSSDPYLFWMIAPSPDGQFAAVEFAAADTATFVYRTGGDFPAFAGRLNRALEAISFRREVIRLTDGELQKPENADYYMAARRTASLQFIRRSFAGRVIHTNPQTWKQKLTELWSGAAE